MVLAFDDCVGHLADQQFDGADGVIVGGDHVIHRAGVAVGVEQGDHGDALEVGFMHGGVLAHNIHDEDQVRGALHFAHTGEAGNQFLDVAADEQAFFFGQPVDLAGFLHFFQPVQFLDAVEHGASSW